MKTKITYKDLVALKHYYHPLKIGIKTNYSATIPIFIREYRNKVKNKEDIIWLLCRNDYMTDRNMRLFAVWCAREALKLISEPDQRSINACEVAEKYANGKATKEELNTIRDYIRTTNNIAFNAVRDPVNAVIFDIARDNASDAAISAAKNYTNAYASSIDWYNTGDVKRDAWDIAWDNICSIQIVKLLTYFE